MEGPQDDEIPDEFTNQNHTINCLKKQSFIYFDQQKSFNFEQAKGKVKENDIRIMEYREGQPQLPDEMKPKFVMRTKEQQRIEKRKVRDQIQFSKNQRVKMLTIINIIENQVDRIHLNK